MPRAFKDSSAQLLINLVNDTFLLHDYLKKSEDPSLDIFKTTLEIIGKKCGLKARDHEEKHGTVYIKNGIEPEYFLRNKIPATSSNKKSLLKWLSQQRDPKDSYLALLKEVVAAPGDDMGPGDKFQLDILMGNIKSTYSQKNSK